MYVAEIVRKRSGAPVLSRKEIDIIGENLVSDFNPDAMQTPQEIDIDLFVQDYLGADQDFQYLSHCGVYLGMTVFNDTDKVPVYDPIQNRAEYISARANTIIIDRTLLEENQEHRYRFTMGHEASHAFLHTPYFTYDPNQITLMDLLGERKEAALIKAYLMAWNALVENRESFLKQWKQQMQGEDLLARYRAEKFVEYTKDAKPLKEMDTDFMLKTLDHIKVFEDGTLLVVFLDGSEIECRSEEA